MAHLNLSNNTNSKTTNETGIINKIININNYNKSYVYLLLFIFICGITASIISIICILCYCYVNLYLNYLKNNLDKKKKNKKEEEKSPYKIYSYVGYNILDDYNEQTDIVLPYPNYYKIKNTNK